MNAKVDRVIDKLSLPSLLAAYLIWIILFSFLYWFVPLVDENSSISSLLDADSSGFLRPLFFSISVATGSGFGDLTPKGMVRGLAIVEVLGGIIFAGVAVNLLASLPSRTARLAARACNGYWVEEISMPERGDFYSLTFMVRTGEVIKKDGYNFDPDGGPMDRTRFNGQLITSYFPVMISVYRNDQLSSDYSDGFLKFEMKVDSDGKYNSYMGACYDRVHGCRDRIVGRRISDSETIQKLKEGGELDDETHKKVVAELFPRSAVL